MFCYINNFGLVGGFMSKNLQKTIKGEIRSNVVCLIFFIISGLYFFCSALKYTGYHEEKAVVIGVLSKGSEYVGGYRNRVKVHKYIFYVMTDLDNHKVYRVYIDNEQKNRVEQGDYIKVLCPNKMEHGDRMVVKSVYYQNIAMICIMLVLALFSGLCLVDNRKDIVTNRGTYLMVFVLTCLGLYIVFFCRTDRLYHTGEKLSRDEWIYLVQYGTDLMNEDVSE